MPVQPTISQFLSFSLTTKFQAMLPTEDLGEIIKIDPSQIVPIFDLLPAIMGVYNHRGDVLWVVELALLLGLEPLYKQNYYNSYNVILIKKQNKILGLAVRQVGQLVLCKKGQIRQSSMRGLTAKLAMCLVGEKRNTQGNIIMALDGDKIVQLLA